MTAALVTLLELAVRQRDAGLLALRDADATCDRARLQAEQLLDYRDEQRGRSPVREGRSAPIDALRSHGGYMQRLQDAIDQQQRSVLSARQRADALRTELLRLEQRVASVRKLQHRRLLDDQHHAARADQRRSDDLSQQRAWHQRAEAAVDTASVELD